MMTDHAHVEIDGVKIPLIGIPPNQTEDECDLCHDKFHLQSLLCPKCRPSTNETKQP